MMTYEAQPNVLLSSYNFFDIYCDLKYLMQTHGNMETIYFIC